MLTVVFILSNAHFSPDYRVLACFFEYTSNFLSRKYTLLFRFFGKSLVSPKSCVIISPPGEKYGLEPHLNEMNDAKLRYYVRLYMI